MIRKLNRIFQDFMRGKRLAIGRKIWDKKINKFEFKPENFIESNNIKSILFLRYDGKIGDMVVNTLMFREIKKNYPNIKIGVVAREGNSEIIKNNPNVDKIYLYIKNRREIKKLALEIAEEKYDLLIDFSEMLRVNQMMFINLCGAKFNIGIDKKDWNLFDFSYIKPAGNYHISKIYSDILNILGVKNQDLSYDLHFNDIEKENVDKLLNGLDEKEKIFVFNPFAASKHRDINKNNIEKIIDIILKKENRKVFLVGEKSRKRELEEIIKKYDKKVSFAELNSIIETTYLIKKSDFVITPDTSIVHIAACFKKPMIAIYRCDGKEENNINSNLWAPNYDEAIQIFSKDLDVKVGEEPDINKFNIKDIDEIINNRWI